MKRVIAIGLVVNATLLTGILLKKEVVVHAAGGGGGVPVGNGDVNGDGKIDISDAVYLLSNLFTGGPAVKPIECPPPGVKGLPATGQTTCYDQNGLVIPCDSATCPGQDGSYASGCPSAGRFVDNKDGTVSDNCTGLMWQKDTADTNGDGASHGDDQVTWCDALAYCENLSFAGHDDWRFPNVRELQSIVDYGRAGRVQPAIDPVFGVNDPASAFYWSSTSFFAGFAWLVAFDGGGVDVIGENRSRYVRAVRSGP